MEDGKPETESTEKGGSFLFGRQSSLGVKPRTRGEKSIKEER